MSLPTSTAIPGLYRVEVSGWDRDESFFVEEADLEWTEPSGKLLALQRSLRDGAVVFVRLLQPMSPDRSIAVAYKAEGNGARRDGQYLFRLKPALPPAAAQSSGGPS